MRLIPKLIVPFSILLCAAGALLFVTGLAEKQSPFRLIVAILLLLPLGVMVMRGHPDQVGSGR